MWKVTWCSWLWQWSSPIIFFCKTFPNNVLTPTHMQSSGLHIMILCNSLIHMLHTSQPSQFNPDFSFLIPRSQFQHWKSWEIQLGHLQCRWRPFLWSRTKQFMSSFKWSWLYYACYAIYVYSVSTSNLLVTGVLSAKRVTTRSRISCCKKQILKDVHHSWIYI